MKREAGYTRGSSLLRTYDWATRLIARGGWARQYAVGLCSTALVTGGMALSGRALDPANLPLIYPLAVLFTATTAGLGPGIMASTLSFLAYNFFFVEPRYVLTGANPQAVARLFFFLIVVEAPGVQRKTDEPCAYPGG